MNKHIEAYPAYVGWDVYSPCNHNCFYCYNYWRTKSELAPICSTEKLSSIADFIISKKPTIVLISGGEPLLVFEEIKQYIIRFYNNNIFVRIQTNGSLITEEIARFCAEYKIHLMVSFPCENREIFEKITNSKNTYDKVIEGMDYLKKHDVIFSPNIVVSKMNLNQLRSTAEFLIKRYNCEKLFVSRVTRPANASEEFDRYELDKDDLKRFFKECELLQKKYKISLRSCGGYPFCIFPSRKSLDLFAKGCAAGKNDYVVDSEGNVRACSRDGNTLGNIFEDDFALIRQRLIAWGDRVSVPEECKDCSVADVCHGGCRMTTSDGTRSGKSLDCDANPEKAPKRMPKAQKTRISLFKTYEVQSPLNIVQLGEVYRLSCYYRVVYLGKYESEFLKNTGTFSLIDLVRYMGMPLGIAKSFISYLLESEIIK